MSPTQPSARPRQPDRALVAVALLLACCGATARLWDLPRMVVWHDEVYSVIRVLGFAHEHVVEALFTGELLSPSDLQHYQTPDPRHGWADTWRALREHPEHAPLYYLLARLAVEMIDPPITALRAVSALLSVLLLPAIAWLAREIWGRGPALWLALGLAAVSPLHLLYAQEARQYALWSVLIAAATAAWLRALRRGRGADWAVYGLLLALACYTHLLTALLAAIHLVYGLWLLRGDPAAMRRLLGRLAAVYGGVALLFSPWLLTLWEGRHAAQDFTAWMTTPASWPRLLGTWADHLARPFVDLPQATAAWLAILPLLAVALWRSPPRSGRGLLWLLLLVPFAVVALPDILAGGRRSLEARYLLPAFIALQLLVAGALARTWQQGPGLRQGAAGVFVALLLAGLASQWHILDARSWWTKSFSARNAVFAQQVNAAPAPLLLASASSVSLGELLSLSYHLEPQVRIQLEPPDGEFAPAAAGRQLYALLPSERLRAQLQGDYVFEPVPGTWQWFVLRPRTAPAAGQQAALAATAPGCA